MENAGYKIHPVLLLISVAAMMVKAIWKGRGMVFGCYSPTSSFSYYIS
jgi:hypothetical protein